MRLEDRLAERFVCPKYHQRAEVKRFAATGTGLSSLLDVERNVFIAASCEECGCTEIYSPEILEGKDNPAATLDPLFGNCRAAPTKSPSPRCGAMPCWWWERSRSLAPSGLPKAPDFELGEPSPTPRWGSPPRG